jgi:hypothetical protein
MIDEFSAVFTLRIITFETDQDVRGAEHVAIHVRAMQMGGSKSWSATFSNVDEFMNRLGLMLCGDSFRWQEVGTLLNQQGTVKVAGHHADVAFTELELRELGLKEDVRAV